MNIKIEDVLDILTTPKIPIENTVDNLLLGSVDTDVTGIAVAFLASQEVIEKAKDLGVNLIISHEGIFYSHRDNHKILQRNSVYIQKYRTIQKNDLAIFRYHDYIHRCFPDGITAGLLKELNWVDYEVENLQTSSILEIPENTAENLIVHIKKQLGISYVRFIGDLSMSCKRIGILVGYRGSSEITLPLFQEKNLDLIIYGEGPEWETPEYVKDAVQQGKNKALIVLGHGESEMPGMKYLAQWLQKQLSDIPVYFIPQKSVFQIR
ncbi:Nif3-like dinuclear metal center hexameric protein [Clostridium oryzae]|uniref:GTP cyclohydrolase 1 type 2 homolog n=1 Tax=Clostridium oryzae TaxID=1450648 RepID=A0A1V4IJ75_9CLOT|nr:Nif3-like dinuclear metal center hexameric protein [Clostridium oryzae]OPJ59884.1 metal-binding protein [Clostridium oryzae]